MNNNNRYHFAAFVCFARVIIIIIVRFTRINNKPLKRQKQQITAHDTYFDVQANMLKLLINLRFFFFQEFSFLMLIERSKIASKNLSVCTNYLCATIALETHKFQRNCQPWLWKLNLLNWKNHDIQISYVRFAAANLLI